MFSRSSAAISPTAHYTGEVWRRNGLSHPALGTWQGRLLHAGLRAPLGIGRRFGGVLLEDFLLARHRLIDGLLEADISGGRIGQVVEIAAGMSPRGLRLLERHPEVTYLEADLPAMAARKRQALRQAGATHRIADFDAIADTGPLSLAAIVAELDPDRGLAIVTEGLLNYFPRTAVDGIWRRIAAALAGFPKGLYVSDLHLANSNSGGIERAFVAALGAFVRGRVHLPYRDESDARAALLDAGFSEAALHRGGEQSDAPGADRVHVIEARIG